MATRTKSKAATTLTNEPERGGAVIENHVHYHYAHDPETLRVIEGLLAQQRSDIMASYAELRTELDGLKGNVQKVLDHLSSQNAKLDELKAVSDNGTEEQFQALIDEMKAENARLMGAVPAAAPVEGEQPAPDAAPPADETPPPPPTDDAQTA